MMISTYLYRTSQARANEILSELKSALADEIDEDDVQIMEEPKTKAVVIFKVHEVGKEVIKSYKIAAPLVCRVISPICSDNLIYSSSRAFRS